MEKGMILETKGLTKNFGGIAAVNNLNLKVTKDEIRGLIGPNGSGKTTFINTVTGVLACTSGEIKFKGHSIHGLKPHSIASLGVSRTFQQVLLFNELTVLENVILGRHYRTYAGIWDALFRTPRSRREEEAAKEHALGCLALVGLEDKASELAKNLPEGQRRLVEVARALATEPKLFFLDEPTGGMTEQEVSGFLKLIKEIHARSITIFLIEHNMRVVMEVAEFITVINYGMKIAEGPPEEIQRDKEVIDAYLGK
jgi:ABC-type branched-subunit amino acid transport system ATPase component